MADKQIVELPSNQAITDETLFPAYQPGAVDPAQKVTGAQLAEFAEEAGATAGRQAAGDVARGATFTPDFDPATGQMTWTNDFGLPNPDPAQLGGVTTFNGRAGAVTPQSGDYTADMVGAAPIYEYTITNNSYLSISVPQSEATAAMALVTVRYRAAQATAQFLLTGYAVGGIRADVFTFVNDISIPCGVNAESDNGPGLTLHNALNQNAYVSVVVIRGGVPVVENANNATSLSVKGGFVNADYVAANAAPAGFGYGGERMPSITAASSDEADAVYGARFDSILSTMEYHSSKQVVGFPPLYRGYGYSIITIYNAGDGYATVTGTAPYYADFSGYWRMICRNGVWSAIEYSDPPMQLGVEYRTTERINGKAVYKRSVDGVIQYRLDGETTWKPYAQAVGGVNKAGDTITGTLAISANSPLFELQNNSVNRRLRIMRESPYTTLYDMADGNNFSALVLQPETASEAELIRYATKKNGASTVYRNILHTGNKPSGSYTGNGDATARDINIGGIGFAVIIRSNSNTAIITSAGGIVASYSTVTPVIYSEAHFSGGYLTLATTNAVLNTNGQTYQYQVL